MKPEDAPALMRQLESLSAIYGRKAPSELVVTAWFQHLSEYPVEIVTWALDKWPSSNDFFPTIAQARKVVGEEHARRFAARDKRLGEVDAAQWNKNAASTAVGRNAVASIKQIKTSPRPPGLAWAYKLRDREQSGQTLTPLQSSMWRTALRWSDTPAPPATPAETEEQREARIEREAIQAEAA